METQDFLIPEPLEADAFAPYGWLLQRQADGQEPFQVILTRGEAAGWRIASLLPPPGPLSQVHRHPDTDECFIPLRGRVCIAVAPAEDPQAVRLFRLDRGVCVRAHVWHQLLSLDGEAEVQIVENATVSGQVTSLGQIRQIRSVDSGA